MQKLYIGYYRVSTVRQGQTQLGLEAQRSSVLSFIKNNGNKLIAEFVEIESGKVNQRPELVNAIEKAKQCDATLIVAKLDRLSRNLTFISTLMDTKVKFVCVDMPEANELTIGLMAVLAQWERQRISERTKAALAAKRAREPYWQPGTNNLTDAGRAKSRETLKNNALQDQNSRHAFHFIYKLKKEGLSYHAIAERLNEEGYKTRRGGTFSAMQVRNIWLRFKDILFPTKSK